MFPIQEVHDTELVFGAANVSTMMPSMQEIPKDYPDKSGWVRFTSRVFFEGLKGAQVFPRDGVDKGKALRHIRAILVSLEPKHEHKEAACAYLLSQWFTGWQEQETPASEKELESEKAREAEWKEWYEKKVAAKRCS